MNDHEKIIRETIIRHELKAELRTIHDKLYADDPLPQPLLHRLVIYYKSHTKKIMSIAALALLLLGGLWSFMDTKTLNYAQLFANNKYELDPSIVVGAKGVEIDNDKWISYFTQKDYNKAIQQLLEIRKQEDIEPFIPYFLGVSYMENQQIDLALTTFELLLSENPNLYILRKNAVYYQIALCYLQKRDKHKALYNLSLIDIQEDKDIEPFVKKLQTSLQ